MLLSAAGRMLLSAAGYNARRRGPSTGRRGPDTCCRRPCRFCVLLTNVLLTNVSLSNVLSSQAAMALRSRRVTRVRSGGGPCELCRRRKPVRELTIGDELCRRRKPVRELWRRGP